MEKELSFIYRYSAKENKEIQEIRNKYLPKEENKIEELKRLDNMVEASGVAESLCLGIGGALVFGLGMCLAMQIIGKSLLLVILGVLISIIGSIAMIFAYPVHQRIYQKNKEKYAARIIQLAEEISEKN